MSELENVIGSIMSSPEALDRVMELAKMFGGDDKKEERGEREMPPSPAPSLDLDGLGAGLDPAMLSSVMGLLNEYNADDRRIRLLGAIRPYLKDADSFHIDRAIQIVKLSHVARGIFGNFLK
ncbi:MAG: hypothetical protein IKU65_04505 [Oscillospiraceae bacterium]|nr:hypothetical protein [Oscillospiraceae bacterium]